jgi:hypothetical protein
MTEHFQQVLEKAVGQTPDDMSIGNANENARVSHLRAMRSRKLDRARFEEHVGQRKPKGSLDFLWFELESLILGQEECVGLDHECRTRARISYDVVELTKIFGVGQLDPNLLEGLTPCGVTRRPVALFQTTARKIHVPGPGIAFSLGSLDQEHLDRSRTLSKHDRDGGVRLAGNVGSLRVMRTKSLSNEVDLHVDQLSGPRSALRASLWYSG